MDNCYADDYCAAFEAENLEISETNPSISKDGGDQFFITFEVETTLPNDDDDGEEEEIVLVESTKSFTFWAKCPRFKEGNLSRERISMMLSMAGVARHKQGFMIDVVSLRADQIANAARNKGARLLPMMVSISIVACSCYEEAS
ncbi:RING-type E3 ubiquitin transferase [Salvia divinorum]|uniref:RING-type E3 ubiquitin transferase n=1 Tax=Salvia divinorum TaxID=28513 RepID=A0ABD1IG68_SALDI